ncbi:outer membrane beta-barrel protein [Tardiphaga sp. P9-11]|jgi:opacity protein-like surface antigen|uniref:outer membrane protein n=1 Tax=Tardiphaga sp. P9-11 TaxID=2024614 RepID=UPI0011F1A0B0|nr:outer membrane beta-barrel protein [Tardiphaga sp. P9-11]KAA0075172.1 porin family protein [Tardiphaga sp. P9-11]
MRKFIFAAVLSIAAPAAHAADLPILRGSLSEGRTMGRSDWDGFYIGAQAGIGQSDMNFSGATRTLAGGLLDGLAMESAGQVSQWPLLGKASQRGEGWGGFIGYNSQWDDVVIGVEMSYLHGKFGGDASGSMGRSFIDALGYTNGVTYDAAAKMSITDMGTLRARAGYAVGAFLPYMFGGLALGQADIVRSARIHGVAVNVAAAPGFQNIPFDYSKTEGQYSHLIYGYSAGLGVDINLIGGLFARAEWEYVRFTSSVDTNINTVRAGVGYKF